MPDTAPGRRSIRGRVCMRVLRVDTNNLCVRINDASSTTQQPTHRPLRLLPAPWAGTHMRGAAFQHVISYVRPLLCRDMFIPRERNKNPGCHEEMKFRNETQGRCIEMLVLTIRDTRSSRGVPAPCEPYSSSSMIAMLSRCTTYADAGGALYDATRGHTRG